MPSTNTICYYAMYVIAEVESEWTWTSVYYDDPITIGIMQWYGTRAAGLLNRIKSELPSEYEVLAASLKDDLEKHNETDNFWNSRYLTLAEGVTIVACFSSDANHMLQEEQAINDLAEYIPLLENWGLSQTRPKELIFAMSMYHQSPRQAGKVIASCGGSADLELMYTTCMNDSVFSNYKNRYTTVYNRLKAWDGESNPPDFGQNGTVTPGLDTGIGVIASRLGYIIQSGNDLVLYGRDDYSRGILFYAASGQRWINGYNGDGTGIAGGYYGGGSTTGSAGQIAVVQLYTSWVGKFDYAQAPGRLDPINSGFGDCSSTVWYAYHVVTGINVGTYTGEMIERGTLIASGSGSDPLPYDIMQLGDLVLMTWSSEVVSHVEMYIGNRQICGHGGPGKGPTIKDASAYMSGTRRWYIRRYL